MIMPAVQKPHWNAWRVEKGLLHRVQLAGLRQPFDGGDHAPRGAKGRHQAGMHRHAVEPDRTGAAIARIAALLDAEHATLAQKRPQALSGQRFGGKQMAVHGVVRRKIIGVADLERKRGQVVHALAPGCANSARICSAK
jgi:hypothetical protein